MAGTRAAQACRRRRREDNGTYRDAVTGDTRIVTDGELTVAASGKGNLRVCVLNGPGKIGTTGTHLE
ncbi:hypothetical protein GPZ77_01590 [Streptomyces sp. QHH-9511]|nr:hypothetical protein GPZ77_01590 [Streptomyces sp. QHH-9511]